MATPSMGLELAHAPARLEEAVEWFDSLSGGLVLLEPLSLADVRRAIAEFRSLVRDHLASAEVRLRDEPLSVGSRRSLVLILRSDHTRFETSLEQIDWFLRIAEADSHGGNRQALGQYGRLLAEAVRRHLADERRLAAEAANAVGKP